ncbi:hypothetical protein LCGC14_0129410 [marine sediment metagenome]|uniref:Uncharacterized protein n=2 Tax=root TaxID=1 RepID=A0A0F9V867_9ZZZZ
MFFDVADLDFLEEVIVDEMRHVLGIGTLRNTAPYGFYRTLSAGPGSNLYFTTKKANVFWNSKGIDINELGDEGTVENSGLNITKMEVILTVRGFVNTKKQFTKTN